ncbi:Male sterility [Labilibaculum filiforme]|uniref:Male sterility n=1 Tax=Labilibaculum filiforme TaxID=1940526 RepID=A0A2N3HTP0_9BACT|nr:SDR family oxidoreductase [Labilibaculum filiforme]PKQ61430.1 Male sterility [Labilibaculum filiforme]
MKRIIINGANGFVASNFITELLKQNYEVIALVRDSNKCSSRDRMNNVLAEINDADYCVPENLTVYGYSLLDDNFGLEKDLLEDLFNGDVDYYHFAASLKYDLKSKDEIFATNIDGVKNSLNVFLEFSNKTSRFFFISTAYSCGKFSGVFEERFYDNEDISKFRNYYEQSKRYAENIIREYRESKGLDIHILRLSQVVGNNQSGVTKTDYGIFDFAKRVHGLAHRSPNSKVRVKVDPESTQNLIPIDTVVSYLMRTAEAKELPVIMNFIAKNSTKNKNIINSLCKLLPIHIEPSESIKKEEMNVVERIISIGMSFTGSYVSTNLRFDTKNLDCFIDSDGAYEANEQTIHKMLEYFLDSLSNKKVKNIYVRAS